MSATETIIAREIDTGWVEGHGGLRIEGFGGLREGWPALR